MQRVEGARGKTFRERTWQRPFPEGPRRGKGETMRPYRDIAALAGLQVPCFLFLSHLEPSFFLLHFYQTVMYLAILILLFYMEDRSAYMIIAPRCGWP